jgi:hypothetical protein
MMQYGFWFSAMAETDATRGNVVMIPGATWAGKRRDPTMTATGMVMAEESANPDAAWVLFEWYNGGALAKERASSGWGVPALKSMLDLIPKETDFQKQCLEVLNGELALQTSPLQFNPYLGEMDVSNSWKTQLEQALGGGISFDEMLVNVQNEINLTISDNEAVISTAKPISTSPFPEGADPPSLHQLPQSGNNRGGRYGHCFSSPQKVKGRKLKTWTRSQRETTTFYLFISPWILGVLIVDRYPADRRRYRIAH